MKTLELNEMEEVHGGGFLTGFACAGTILAAGAFIYGTAGVGAAVAANILAFGCGGLIGYGLASGESL